MVRSPGMVILFDIDGTLIDHDTAETIAVAALRGRMGHTHGAVGSFNAGEARSNAITTGTWPVNYRSSGNGGSAFVKS